MDLDSVRNVKASFDELDADEQEHMRRFSAMMVDGLRKTFPALVDSDLAAIGWEIARVCEQLRGLEVAQISVTLEDSSVAYAMATLELLGWM